jgi:hypothetical protein
LNLIKLFDTTQMHPQIANASGDLCSAVPNATPDLTALSNYEDAAYKYATDNLAVVSLVMSTEKSTVVHTYVIMGVDALVNKGRDSPMFKNYS